MACGHQERKMMGQEIVAVVQLFATTIVAVMSIRLSNET
jgi:hypothetical protein